MKKNQKIFIFIVVSVVLCITVTLVVLHTTGSGLTLFDEVKSVKLTPNPRKNAEHRAKTRTSGFCQSVRLNPKEITNLKEEIVNKFGSKSFYTNIPTGDKKNAYISVPAVPLPLSLKGVLEYGKFSYLQRKNSIDGLGNDLNSDEINALLLFLHKQFSEENNRNGGRTRTGSGLTLLDASQKCKTDPKLPPLTLSGFNTLKNQAAMALLRQRNTVVDLPKHLISIYYDKSYDTMWRNYCIQFLGQGFPKIDNLKIQNLVKYTLFDALNEYKNGIAAPALFSLKFISKNDSSIRNKLANKALLLAAGFKSDTDYSVALKKIENKKIQPSVVPVMVRIGALQIAAKFNKKNALLVARRILSDKNSSEHFIVLLQMSAIATIGLYGENKDLKIIQPFIKSSDYRLRVAANGAVKKLKT